MSETQKNDAVSMTIHDGLTEEEEFWRTLETYEVKIAALQEEVHTLRTQGEEYVNTLAGYMDPLAKLWNIREANKSLWVRLCNVFTSEVTRWIM